MTAVRIQFDSAKFEHLAKSFDKIADTTPALMSKLSARLARRTKKLIRNEVFGNSSSPYGQKWAPHKRPYGHSTILRKTFKLFNSIGPIEVNSKGFTIGSRGVSYANFHNTGTRRMPPRIFLPISGIPGGWAQNFSKITKTMFRKHIRTHL